MGIQTATVPASAMGEAAAPLRGWSALAGEHGLLALGIVLLAAIVLLVVLNQRRLREQREHLKALREREARTRLALWASGELYWQYDMATRELERMRVDPDAGGGLDVNVDLDRDDYIHPDDLPMLQERLRAYLRGQEPYFLAEHRAREGDKWQWLRARGRAVAWDADGRITRIAGTARNISSIREKERERRISGEVMRSMAEAVVVVGADFRFATVNPAFTRISGYDERDVLGEDVALLDSAQHDRAFYQGVRQGIIDNPSWSGEMWQRRKDGREFLCEVRSHVISEPGTGARFYVMVWSDITERRRIEQELRYLANYDTLTNLPNRTLLTERLSRAIVRARRQGSRLGLLFLDLDHFKDVNDTLGHATGDRTLRAVAQRLQEVVGSRHTIARIGGDEFTVMLEDLGAVGEAEACARRIIAAFDAPLRMDNRQDITITPSIGISIFPDHGQVPTDLLKQADTAMYQAKAAGRRTFLTYVDAMEIDIRRRASLLASLRRVVERGELRLVFQPQMALADGRVVGVEALLRWDSPEHGQVPPTQFIPLAEESGLIVEIGAWVVREACRTLAGWRASGVGDELVMSVNVSAVQLLRSDLPETVRAALDATGLPTRALELELTESVVMAQAELAHTRLQAFKAMDVAIAIDDFGTGYSSLAYLRRLPITTLKIDKAFIDGLSGRTDTEDNAIASTIVAMSHSLGLRVVAEGVETQEQLDVLRSHGCDRIQGYWLSPPLSADACLAFLQARASAAA
ncbi:hypothetical protein MASR1M8_27410 [Thermomonas brevis]